MTYTLTTYGGGEAIYYVLHALSALLGGGDFLPFVLRMTGIFGIFFGLSALLFKGNGGVSLKWGLWFALVSHLLFLPQATVLIRDPLNPGKFPRTVEHVPYMIGMIGGGISTLGDFLTTKIESTFSLPDYLPYHETGSLFASRLMKDAAFFRIQNPEFHQNMERFVQRCIVYDVMIGSKYTMKELKESSDIWSLVKDKASPVLGFSYRDGKNPSDIITCREGAQKLEAVWQKELDEAARRYGSSYFNPGKFGRGNGHGPGEAAAKAAFLEKLPLSFSFLTGVAESAEKLIQQEMMINAIRDGVHNKTAEYDGGLSYGGAKTLLQQRSSYVIAGEIAGNILPVMKNVFEALAYGSFLFVFILILLPGGMGVLKRYFELLIWIQLWPPLYAILNLFISLGAKYQSEGLLMGEGLTMINSYGLSKINEDMAALAGWLSLSVPFLSYMFMKGGVAAFLNMAGTIGGALQSSLTSAAGEVASGNMSLSNVNFENMSGFNASGFQRNMAPFMNEGQMRDTLMDGTERTIQGSGEVLFKGGVGFTRSQFASEIYGTNSLGAQLSQSAANEFSLSETASLESQKHMSQGIREGADYALRRSEGKSSSEGYGFDRSTSHGQSMNNLMRLSKSLQEKHGIDERTAAEYALAFSLEGSAGFKALGIGATAGISGRNSFSSGAARTLSSDEVAGVAKELGYTENKDSIMRALQDERYAATRGKERALSESAAAHFEKGESLRESSSLHKTYGERLSKAASLLRSSSFDERVNLTHDFLTFVAAQHGAGKGEPLGLDYARKVLEATEGPLANQREMYLEAFREKRVAAMTEMVKGGDFKTAEDLSAAFKEKSRAFGSLPKRDDRATIQDKGQSIGAPNDSLQSRVEAQNALTQKEIDTQGKEHVLKEERKAEIMHQHKMDQNVSAIAARNAGEAAGKTWKDIKGFGKDLLVDKD